MTTLQHFKVTWIAYLFFALAFSPLTSFAAPSPNITTQPQNQAQLAGSNVTFSVVSDGQSPLTYQWSFNGTNLTNSVQVDGVTNTTLTLSNITAANAGNYYVIVSNRHGTATSSNATLTVLIPPAITSQPASQSVLLNANASFSAATIGTAPLNHQWYFNGMPLTNGSGVSGSTTTSLNISNIQTNNSGSYELVVTNNYGSATSVPVTLTVLVPAFISSQPSSQSVHVNSNATFAATAGGTGLLNYKWHFNGAPLADGGQVSGSTTPNLNISNVQTNHSGIYRLVVTNHYGSATSAVATLTVLTPPSITTQPTNRTALLGRTAVFSVVGTGTAPLFYQWQKDQTNLINGGKVNGASSPTLTILNMQMSDRGSYQMILSNSYGVVRSDEAKLSVVPVVDWDGAGQLDTIPLALTNATGIAGGADFSLALDSHGKVTAWGANGSGQINVPSDLSNVLSIAAGEGHALALKSDGTVTSWGNNNYGQRNVPTGLSNVVALAAGYGHSLALKRDGTVVGWGWNGYGQVSVPAGLNDIIAIAAGDYVSLALKSDGTVVGWGTTSYGQTTPPAGLSDVVAIAAGAFHCLALKQDGTVVGWGLNGVGQSIPPAGLRNVVAIAATDNNSLALKSDGKTVNWGWGAGPTPSAASNNVVAIATGGWHSLALAENPTVQVPPMIWWQQTDHTVPAGKGSVFSPILTGSLPMSFQWYFNGTAMAGETNKWLVSAAIQPDQVENYHFVVSNNYGSVTSQVAMVSETPSIKTHPINQTVLVGSNVNFNATATGIGTLFYQWYLNGLPLTDNERVIGSTTTNLAISDIQTTDAGNYQLLVTNSYGGTATSSAATLTVVTSPTITGQPTDRTVLSGSNATFTVTASGSAPLSYLWYSNGVALVNGGRISGVTTATLTIFAVQPNDAASYHVVVTNAYGSATSAEAVLTVYNRVQIAGHPGSQAVLLGSNATFTVTADGSAPLNYQWYYNGTPLTDGGQTTGSTTPTLTITGVQPNDIGGYVAVVTNLMSTATSRTASLTPQAGFAPSVRYVNLNNTNPQPPYLSWDVAATTIQDAIDAAVSGDTILVTNGLYVTGGYPVYGTHTNRISVDKSVTVQSVNGPALTSIRGSVPNGFAGRCAYLTNGASLIGFTLTTGRSRLRDGDRFLEQSGGGVWCEGSDVIISNCIFDGNYAYQYGGGAYQGTLVNCLLTNNVASGGALFPASGGGTYASIVSNCTLVNNVGYSGGGVSHGTVTKSLLSGNRTETYGGGAYNATVINCVIRNNQAGGKGSTGGGSFNCTLVSCTVVSNTAGTTPNIAAPPGTGGGAYGGSATNCIIYYNYAQNGSNFSGSSLSYCDTLPLAPGTGNITNNPAFLNLANGDFRLQSNSPCINAGYNSSVITTTEFDGNPRIVGGTVDIGAYEFQTPGSLLSYVYAQQYGLPTDGSADFIDSDGDAMNNWQEWRSGTDPVNALSLLQMLPPTNGVGGVAVQWQSVSGITYFLERSTNLGAQPSFQLLQSDLPGASGTGTTTYMDTNASGAGPFFYRVGVQ